MTVENPTQAGSDHDRPRPVPTTLSVPAVKESGLRPKKTSQPKRVLVVEDNLDSARSLSMLIEDIGHTANYAINGYVAVDLVPTFKPDIVLLDLGLPGIDGVEVCKRIKANPETAHVRVIVLTAHGADEFRIRSQAAGCELHLLKPISAAVLEQILG